MSDFDVQSARKAGYSDAEIAEHLASMRGFDVGAARKAGYKDREIVDHLSPPPSLGRRALDAVGEAADTAFEGLNTGVNYLGTQTVKAAGGIAGIPRAVGEGMDWVSKKTGVPVASFGPPALMAAFKDYLPSGEQVSNAFFEATGAPEVKLEGNIPGGKIIDAGVQGALSIPMTGGASIPALMAGALGGAGSEALGQWAEGTPYEIPARVGGAIVGGGVGAGTALAGKKALDVIKSTAAPFTAAGRERLAGTALRNSAANADDAVVALDRHVIGKEAFPDAVPGFQIDAGRASRDPGLMATADILPDKVRGAMVLGNNARITSALDRMQTGLPDDPGSVVQNVLRKRFDDLVKARRDAVDPLYEAARKSPEPVKPFPLLAYTADTVAATKGEPKAVMERARSLLFTTDKNGKTIADRSARGMMATRTAIGDMLDKQDLGNHSRSLLMEMKTKIDEALDAVPLGMAANAKFAEMSRPLDPFNKDLGVTNKVVAKAIDKPRFGGDFTTPAEQVPSQFMRPGIMGGPMIQKLLMAAGGNPEVKKAMQSAYLADFRKNAMAPTAQDAASNPMATAAGAANWLKAHRGGAVHVLTQDQLGALDDISKHLTAQAQTVPGRSGSPTYNRLASQSILSAIVGNRGAEAPGLHAIKRMMGVVYGGADDAIEKIVLDAIADPRMASALMKKATEGNIKLVEPILQQIARGATVPATSSGERGSR